VQNPYEWDHYSDQPYQLKDKRYKKKSRKMVTGSLIRTALYSLIFLPLALLATPFRRAKEYTSADIVALVVDPLRYGEETLEMIGELGVKKIEIRIKMWELDSLRSVEQFCKRCDTKILFVLMQDRESVVDEELRQKSFETIFKVLSPYSNEFVIGTTINRAKWGFWSVDEYLLFYKSALDLRNKEYPNLLLIGGGVIDFEYHFFAHVLSSRLKFDAISSLLYVDRRGAPERSQLGFDLVSKINLLSSLIALKQRVPLYITETNYPLTGTAPYAPTSEKEAVSESEYSCYMVRYFLLALASKQVKSVFWHQLIASGYGLVDARGSTLRKREAFYAFKTLVAVLDGSEFITLAQKRDLFEMLLQRDSSTIRIFWSGGSEQRRYFSSEYEFVDMSGKKFITNTLLIGAAPIYLIEDNI